MKMTEKSTIALIMAEYLARHIPVIAHNTIENAMTGKTPFRYDGKVYFYPSHLLPFVRERAAWRMSRTKLLGMLRDGGYHPEILAIIRPDGTRVSTTAWTKGA